jgi:hypothetical protein
LGGSEAKEGGECNNGNLHLEPSGLLLRIKRYKV